jgi:hypothetical protein
VFLCPNTGARVQGWFADNGSKDSDDTYQSVNCLACQRVHLVNPATGKVGAQRTNRPNRPPQLAAITANDALPNPLPLPASPPDAVGSCS